MTRPRRIPLALPLLAALLLPAGLSGQMDPATHYALRDSADAAAYAGDFDRAAALYRRLAGAAPGDNALWEGLAVSEFRRGELEAALEAGRRAVELGHTFGPEGPFILGWIHARQGRRDGALRWLRRALEEGYGDRPRLRRDSVFRPFHGDPEFRELAGIPPEGLSRDEGWRFDLAYLREEVERMHAGPDRPWADEGFQEAFSRLHDRVPELPDEAVLMELHRLLAYLDDGHTAIHGVGEGSPLELETGRLPVKLYDFPDGLFVVEADSAHAALVGARVERLGPLSPEEALGRLRELRGGDNAMTVRWLGPQFYLTSLRVLRAIGAARGDSVVLRVTDGDGPRPVTLRGGDWSPRRKLRPQAAADTARWLRRVEENYWLETLEPGVVYWQFNQVRDREEGPDLEAFADVLSDTLRAGGARELVVDLRHNNGGDNSLVWPLARALVAWEQEAPDHRIWVLTGRNTFSAAQNFLNRVERWTDAVVVGEPSASRPNFVGESTNLELPWSRVHGSVSNRYWQDSDPFDDRPWIHPRVPVALSSGDYFGGRDPVLEAVLTIVREGERGD